MLNLQLGPLILLIKNEEILGEHLLARGDLMIHYLELVHLLLAISQLVESSKELFTLNIRAQLLMLLDILFQLVDLLALIFDLLLILLILLQYQPFLLFHYLLFLLNNLL